MTKSKLRRLSGLQAALILSMGAHNALLPAAQAQTLLINGGFNDPTGTSVSDCVTGEAEANAAPDPWQVQSTPDYSTERQISFYATLRERTSLVPPFEVSPDGGCFQGFRSWSPTTNEGVYQTTQPIADASQEQAFVYEYTEYTVPGGVRCEPLVEFRVDSTDDTEGTAISTVPNVGEPGGPAAEGQWVQGVTDTFVPADYGVADGETLDIYFGVIASDCVATWGFVDGIALAPPPRLTKGLAPASIEAGGVATYTWTLDNDQSAAIDLDGISFTDALPASIRVAAAPGLTNTCGGSVTAPAGGSVLVAGGIALGAGASCTIGVDVTNIPGETNADCASNPAAFTNGAANILASERLLNALTPQCLVVHPPTTLSVTKSASVDPVTAGVAFDYSIVVTNTGSHAAQNPRVVDDLAGSLTVNSVTASGTGDTSGTSGNHVECHWTSIAAGASETCTINVTP